MEYLVTARKWRPQTFGEVIGQEHVTRALINAINSGKIPHAFLFSGPRGVGKTTTARILAKALNCEKGVSANPCNQCSTCEAINNANSLDVREIDGASNRGIDSVREIRDNVTYMPLSARYKIYIIDEVHMLTVEASNALLKTLEEPPKHVIFILATTEPQKVISTIRSRCQHYVFKKIPVSIILNHLKLIARSEGFQFTDDGLFTIASAADGSMRDAQSILDQVALYSNSNITEQAAIEVLGIPDEMYFREVVNAIKNQNVIAMMESLNNYLNQIGEIKLFARGLINYLRSGLMVKNLPFDHELVDLTQTRYNERKKLFDAFTHEEIVRMINILVEDYHLFRGDAQERFILETSLFKLMDYKNIVPLYQIREEMIKIIERQSSSPKKSIASQSEISQPSTLAMSPQNGTNAPIQHVKLESPPIQSVKTFQRSAPTSLNPADALRQVLNSQIKLIRDLIKDIVSVDVRERVIEVQMKNPHSAEFLSAKSAEIANQVNNLTGDNYSLHFVYSSEAAVSSESKQAIEQKSELFSSDPATMANVKSSESEVQVPNVTSNQQESEKEEKDYSLTDTIRSLFDAEVE